MPVKAEVIGLTFGRATVLREAPRRDNGCRTVDAQCSCGTVFNIEPRELLRGSTTSCGCYHREVVAKGCIARTRHGETASPEHNSWTKMRQRCYNPRDRKYPDYGARGITVCAAWRESFEAFRDDMGPKPSPAHSIDRIDVDGNYEPSNCRWATPKEQSRNKRAHRLVHHDGRSMPLSEACEMAGINYRSALYRLNHEQSWMPLPALPGGESGT